jgi:hypothetical protein
MDGLGQQGWKTTQQRNGDMVSWSKTTRQAQMKLAQKKLAQTKTELRSSHQQRQRPQGQEQQM